LPAGIKSAVAVIVDRCTDDTARIVHHAIAGWSGAGYEVNARDRPLGALHHRGVRRVLAAPSFGPRRPGCCTPTPTAASPPTGRCTTSHTPGAAQMPWPAR
jgi:hypothetical protein